MKERDTLAQKLAAAAKMAIACELIMAVRHCMMFDDIHADFSTTEILEKYKVSNVQFLAKKAQDIAEVALHEWEVANKI